MTNARPRFTTSASDTMLRNAATLPLEEQTALLRRLHTVRGRIRRALASSPAALALLGAAPQSYGLRDACAPGLSSLRALLMANALPRGPQTPNERRRRLVQGRTEALRRYLDLDLSFDDEERLLGDAIRTHARPVRDQLSRLSDRWLALRNRAAEANVRLVASTVSRLGLGAGGHLTHDDLIQEGALGLLQGLARFDPNRGVRFSTYASYWIVQAITRAIQKREREIRLPLVPSAASIAQATRHLASAGLSTTPGDVAAFARVSEAAVRRASLMPRTVSLDKPISDDHGAAAPAELLAANAPSPLDHCLTAERDAAVRRSLRLLPSRQADVLGHRFGIDKPELTLAAIGQRLAVSKERVRQIERGALKTLAPRFSKAA